MSMSDPIADMLTRIRNAQRVEKPEVAMPSSKVANEAPQQEHDMSQVHASVDTQATSATFRIPVKATIPGRPSACR